MRETRVTFGFACRMALLIAALIAFLVLGAGQASATHVACGDTITEDTTLDSDLSCAGWGLTFGAAGVTLDLGDHTVEGTITTFYRHTTIENGTVSGAVMSNGDQYAYSEADGNYNVIRNLRIVASPGSSVGLTVAGNYTVVRDVQISGGGLSDKKARPCGPCVRGNAGNVIERVRITGGHISLEGSHDFVVRDNRVLGGGIGIFSGHDGEIANNEARAISLGASNDNRLERNLISASMTGISLWFSSRNLLSRNHIRGGEIGIALRGSLVPCAVAYGGPSVDNAVVANTVTGAVGDGVFLEGDLVRDYCHNENLIYTTQRTTVARNRTSGNQDDGIDAESPQTTISRNRALHNGDLGIEAAPRVVDGGGNRAFGNGNPLQCLNVECK
jgi:large repetitive protein